jgi:hypothetical protein
LDSIFLRLLFGDNKSFLSPLVGVEALLLEAEADDLRFEAPDSPDVFFD